MGGKAGAMIAAIAFSSASASVVGVIYTGFVSFRDDAAGISNLVGGFQRAPIEAKVVLDPAKGQVASLTDLPPERAVPGCRDEAGPSRCILLIPSPDLKLSFFGYTVSIPAKWYVDAATDDLYRGGQEQQFLQSFVDPAATKKNAPGSVDQVTSGVGGNDYGYSDAGGISGSSTISTGNVFIVSDQLDPTAYSSANPLLADESVAPSEVGPTAIPAMDSFPSLATMPNTTIPEPSTWMMVLAGFAGLGLARYRLRRRWRARPVPPDCGTA